jgi:catechol 2,3-dioxygenase
MSKIPNVTFSHIGLNVRDLERMVDFYTGFLGFQITDRGPLPLPGTPQIVFLSRDPNEHHQIALVSGRDPSGASTVNQISFHVQSLADLRAVYGILQRESGIGPTFTLNHGNAWSVYTHDPEGNMLEFFVDTPWYVHQPVTDPLDLTQSDEEIVRATEARYKDSPGFQPVERWRHDFGGRLAQKRAD